MKTFTVKMTLEDSQIQGLYQLYLFQLDEGVSPTKQDFLDYMRLQLIGNGNGDFLLPTNGMDDYLELSMSDVNQLMKWGLI